MSHISQMYVEMCVRVCNFEVEMERKKKYHTMNSQ